MAKGKGKALVVGAALVAAGGAAVKAPEIGRGLPEVVHWIEALFGTRQKPTPKPPFHAPAASTGPEAPAPELRLLWLEQDLRRLVPDARFSRSGSGELRVDTRDAGGGIDLFGRWIEWRRRIAESGGTVHPQDRRSLECSLDFCAQAEEKWSISGTCRNATLGASEEGLELSFSMHGRTVSYAFTATEVKTGYGRDLVGGVGFQRTPTGYEAVLCPVKTIRSARDVATFRRNR